MKWIGNELPPFETVSSSAVLCFLALSAIVAQKRLPLLRLPPVAAADSSQQEPLLPPADRNDVEAGKGPSHGAVAVAGRRPVPQPHPSTARVVALTLTRAVAGSVATTCFYLALEMLALKDAVTLFFTSPVGPWGSGHGRRLLAARSCRRPVDTSPVVAAVECRARMHRTPTRTPPPVAHLSTHIRCDVTSPCDVPLPMPQVVAILLDWVVLGHAPGYRGAAATLLTLLGATCVTQVGALRLGAC